jgi:2-polyprenyl-3-methyl-5-hydroxy-6-metoxy-1,4-benzoquinol methylase
MASDFDNYHEWRQSVFPVSLNEREYELFANYFKKNYLKHMPKKKNAKILEIACGMGHFLYFLKKNGYKNIEAIDLDPTHVNQCKALGFNMVVVADMYDYINQLEDSSYDLIVMNDLVEHIPRKDIISFLSTLRMKLRDNGAVIVKTMNCNNIYGISGYFADFTHVMGYTPERMKHVSMLASFSKCKVFNLFVFPDIKYIDVLIKCFWKVVFVFKRMCFFVNAKRNNDVFSKNLLAILYK